MRFKSLDGWRGVCALFIVLFHLPLKIAPFDGLLIRNAYLFVDFFFVLSGFVIAYNYRDRLASRTDVLKFGIRRFGRLWPLHIAMLMAMVALELVKFGAIGSYGVHNTAPFTGDKSLPLIVANFFLVQTVRPESMTSWNGPSWSISVEFWSYFLFAATYSILNKYRVFIAAALCSGSLGALYLGSENGINVVAGLGFCRCIYGFFAGTLLLEIVTSTTSNKFDGRVLVSTALEVFVVFLAMFFIIYAGGTSYSFAAPVLFSAVIFVFSRGNGLISKILEKPFFQKIGLLSYSIYMTHCVFFATVIRGLLLVDRKLGTHILKPEVIDGNVIQYFDLSASWQAVLVAVAFVIAVLAISRFTSTFIELPGIRLSKGLASRVTPLESHAEVSYVEAL